MIDNFTDIELEREQWRDIEGYDGVYQVSDLGRVRSLKFGKVKIKKSYISIGGYLRIQLYKGKKQKSFYVHRLVASAFIPNDDETKIYINHIDECKQNNRIWNLEWCSASYNNTYNNIHHRRINYKQDKIKVLYNSELTINENLKMFKEQGVECGERTVIQLRKDLGLSKPRKYTKRS